MKIDCHTHILNNRILEEYKEKGGADILLCIRFFKGFCGGAFDNREEDFEEFILNNEGLYEITAIDFETNILAQLDILRKRLEDGSKIKGIKLYPGYQHFYPNNERIYSVYNFAREKKLAVVFHSGALYEYKNSEALLKYVNPIDIDEIAVRFPDVMFVISHFGFPYMMETAMVINKNSNVFTDISGVIDEEECFGVFKEDLKKVLNYYPDIASQVMFGTDFTGNDTFLNDVELHTRLAEEVFSEEEKELLFYKNAQKVYNLK